MSEPIIPSPLLHSGLLLDAVASGVIGLVCTVGSGPVASLTGLPQPFLLAVGLVCLGWAAITAFLGARAQLRPALVWGVIALNALWVVESAALLIGGWITPNGLGMASVIAQALAVFAFTEMQYLGLRRSSRVATA